MAKALSALEKGTNLRDFPSQPEPKRKEPPMMKWETPLDSDPIFKGIIKQKSAIPRPRLTNKLDETVLIQDVFKKSDNSIKITCDLIKVGVNPNGILVSKLIMDKLEREQK